MVIKEGDRSSVEDSRKEIRKTTGRKSEHNSNRKEAGQKEIREQG